MIDKNGNIITWTSEQKAGFKITLDFWNWACKSGGCKWEWGRFRELNSFEGECFFCETFIVNQSESDYGICPLAKNNIFCDCEKKKCCKGIYYDWQSAIYIKQTKQYAEQIYQMIYDWMQIEGMIAVDDGCSGSEIVKGDN